MGEALLKNDGKVLPLEKITLAVIPVMKRRAVEKQVAMDGGIPLLINSEIVIGLDMGFLEENCETVGGLDGTQAAQLLTYTAHRLAHVLGAGGDGVDAEHFQEDSALMFLLILRMAGRLNEPFIPKCSICYDLTNQANPVNIEIY